MAVCEYKKGNHLASLEHLKNDELMEKYVSIILKYRYILYNTIIPDF